MQLYSDHILLCLFSPDKLFSKGYKSGSDERQTFK